MSYIVVLDNPRMYGQKPSYVKKNIMLTENKSEAEVFETFKEAEYLVWIFADMSGIKDMARVVEI